MASAWDELEEIRKKVVNVRNSIDDIKSKSKLSKIAKELSDLIRDNCPIKKQSPIDIVSDKPMMDTDSLKNY